MARDASDGRGATVPPKKRKSGGNDQGGKSRAEPRPKAGLAKAAATHESGSAMVRVEADRIRLPGGFSLDLPPLDPDLYINRELSWIDFNRRVLEEAAERSNPLLERLKFAAIFSDNFDGWFMIRLAGLKRKLATGMTDPGPDGRTPTAQFAAVRRAVQTLLDEHAALIRTELLPELRECGIALVPWADLSGRERDRLATAFENDIFPILTPQAIDRGRRFPHISNGSLNLMVELRSPAGARFARVKIPATLPRLVRVEGPGKAKRTGPETAAIRFIWLEDLVSAHLDRLFPGNEISASYPFHVVRDADIDPEEEEDDSTLDLLHQMRESLSLRTFGPVVRLMVDTTLPEDLRDWLVDQLHASDRDLYVVNGPLGTEDLMELMRLDRPDLKDPPYHPVAAINPASPDDPDDLDERPDIFAMLRERDVLLHHPYQGFGTVVDFLRAAAADPDVVAIKQTLYRIGRDSPLLPALIEARDDDTQVAVLVELRARFDEENNITWAETLERRGVHVAFGLAGLKTHCKATLVVRREQDGLRRYVHLGTGNYNASTARIYEDIGLLSSREDLGRDVSELFNALTGFAQRQHYAKLWVAPAHLRDRFLEAIAREVRNHRETGNGYLLFKMNQLVDQAIIRALYAASREGVTIDLIIRGICSLRPGVPGWSETIRVRSLVGRYLEHSRIYVFGGPGPDRRVYLGSADLMERNLDRRVEAVFPLEDPRSLTYLADEVLPAYLRDTFNARSLRPDGVWERVLPVQGEEPFDVQAWLARNAARSTPPVDVTTG
ncbi:MAG: polyphosphate kinase 1 [Thermomicrobiales bacterium]